MPSHKVAFFRLVLKKRRHLESETNQHVGLSKKAKGKRKKLWVTGGKWLAGEIAIFLNTEY